jgi:hypothetical protein
MEKFMSNGVLLYENPWKNFLKKICSIKGEKRGDFFTEI